MPYLHEPLVVECDPDGENIKNKDQAYSAHSSTDERHRAGHPEILLTPNQQVRD